ncbi:sigma-70 family RNA polymerase sigma factor [soil metagenome]
MSKTREDWALVAHARGGDEGAYEALIDRYKNPIHSFIFRSVGDTESARELAQEVFIRAWFALPGVRATGKFSTWLFQIAVNLCRDHAKSKAVRQAKLTESITGEREEIERDLPHSGVAADEAAAQADSVARLEQEIRRLPHNLREPFVLGAVEGASHVEVGEKLGISAKSVEVRIYRARKHLRERLSKSPC